MELLCAESFWGYHLAINVHIEENINCEYSIIDTIFVYKFHEK